MRKQLVLALGLFLAWMVPIAHADVMESMEYVRITPAQPVPPGSKIPVQEVFWYGCPHCFHLQPILNHWLAHMPKGIAFTRQAAAISPYWLPQARAFFAFEDLGLLPALHDKFFNAIHIHHEVLDDADTISAWVAANSHVSAKRFRLVYHSFAVGLAVRKARAQQTQEAIHSVPTFVVDGRYRTNPGLAGGRRQLMKVVDYLVHKAQRRRKPHA